MIQKIFLLLVSFTLSIWLAEGVARFVLDPIDLLQPTMERDEHLNHRIAPGTGGHDARGYRNYQALESASIVAVGDSMTYGVAATADNSWPFQMEQISGKSVYNLALGGYGPLHYRYLVEEVAISLSPEVVVLGIYLGNDFMDAYNLVYSNEFWFDYRRSEGLALVDAGELVEFPKGGKKFLGGLRDLLSKNSVIYAMLSRSFVGDLVREREAKSGSHGLLEIAAHDGNTYINIRNLLAGLNPHDERLDEGFRLSLIAIEQIKQMLTQRDIRLLVAIIPTKASVYKEELMGAGDQLLRTRIAGALAKEDDFRKSLSLGLSATGVEVVDLYEILRTSADRADVYPINDGHPNALGYAVIAGGIWEKISVDM